MADTIGKHLVVGAGFSGATVARLLAEHGYKCVVIDERGHVAGNCHTQRDAQTGIMVHRYGPHIFHTDNAEIWSFISRFGEFMPYRHQVFTTTGGRVYAMPINLLTINQFFGSTFGPKQAQDFIAAQAVKTADPKSFEEQAQAIVGPELYDTFLKHYTFKQWGIAPDQLPAAVAKRLPVHFSYDTNYFNHTRQAMPRDGYTSIVSNMLAHDNIEVRLNTLAEAQRDKFDHVFYTGPIDRYFNYSLGHLGYRTLDFEEMRSDADVLGTAVMNFGDMSVPWTRITEHKFLSPWENKGNGPTIAYRETARACQSGDIPYYPLRLAGEQRMLKDYVQLAEHTQGVTFLGRLGSYAYLDMDAAIFRAMQVAQAAIKAFDNEQRLSAFVHRPL